MTSPSSAWPTRSATRSPPCRRSARRRPSRRNFEISIEVSESKLREYGLTFDDVARAVRRSSIDLPAGSIRTAGGEISLRTKGQAYTGIEYESLVLMTRPDGTRILLGDVAEVVDGFRGHQSESPASTARQSAGIRVLRVGEQSALDVAKAAKAYVEEANKRLPDGVTLQVWSDGSKFLKDRLTMLLQATASPASSLSSFP